MYCCKRCKKEITQAIEGELICAACWNRFQDPESAAVNDEINHTLAHCSGCGAPLKYPRELREDHCMRCLRKWEAMLERARQEDQDAY